MYSVCMWKMWKRNTPLSLNHKKEIISMLYLFNTWLVFTFKCKQSSWQCQWYYNVRRFFLFTVLKFKKKRVKKKKRKEREEKK